MVVVCGPTATGKTSLGISIAKKYNGEIISADSRQVFKRMDIGTGKDLGPHSKYEIVTNNIGYYEIDGVRVYGYDIVEPDCEFSIAQYLNYVQKVLNVLDDSQKLPVIVGGTGFYIKGIVDGIPTAEVPRNTALREELLRMPVDSLYESLSMLDSLKAASLNVSDRKNPRRLIRAIEVAQYTLDHHSLGVLKSLDKNYDTLFIGLTGPKEYLEEKINKRVDERIKTGMKKEIENLMSTGVSWDDQSMYSLGYRQYRDFFEGAVDEENVIAEWKKEERKYAGRQMIWFKKEKRINWFDISVSGYEERVDRMIETWHNRANVQEDRDLT